MLYASRVWVPEEIILLSRHLGTISVEAVQIPSVQRVGWPKKTRSTHERNQPTPPERTYLCSEKLLPYFHFRPSSSHWLDCRLRPSARSLIPGRTQSPTR